MPIPDLGGTQSASQTNVINPSQINSNNDANSQINSAELGHRDVQQVSNDPVSVSWQDKFSNACTSIKNSIVATLSNVKDSAVQWCGNASDTLASMGNAISNTATSIFNSIKSMISSNNNGLSIDSHANLEAGVSIVVDQNDQPGAGMGPGAAVNNMMAMDDVPNQIQANIEAMMNQSGENADVNIVANGPQLSREGSIEGIPDNINLGATAGYIDDVVNQSDSPVNRQIAVDQNIAAKDTNFEDVFGEAGEGKSIDVDALRQEVIAQQSKANESKFADNLKADLDAMNAALDDIVEDMEEASSQPKETIGNDQYGEQ
ncbi:hypothetical protein [Pseudoalteromonas sp. MMG024]|uniref:hypothetical protein n=1 Tax=Pseudoalteromonas sp. MMG024 TaxID=2909980 RepID=UPI001F1B880B|nr:hypothetical protein [Pseudoalteromonas sp. MMG024]MCF6455636.1 hypothetical protein [Pseudoalteromonas sp. MMG024]